MKSANLIPHLHAGGGHIHIGADVFHQNPVLFRNFFADYANYPQLTYGVFDAKGNPNQPPIAVLKDYQQKGFVKSLQLFDLIEQPTLKNFIWLIHSEVYTEAFTPAWGGGAYYQAIRMDRMYWINGADTVELRGFRAQSSVDEFLMELEVIGARMDYLKKRNTRVPYVYENSKPDFSAQGLVNAYHKYITEMGLPWSKYQILLPVYLLHLIPQK